MSTTEKAVAQLKAYGGYIIEHAENIIGDIDIPNYIAKSGVTISFTLLESDAPPLLHVAKDFVVVEVVKVRR